jgi:SAM-dependent methyltransferase
MEKNPKLIVAEAYNEIAEIYLERFGSSKVRDAWSSQFIAGLPARAEVLDLGCGAGVPVAERLVLLGHRVIGVDNSTRQIEIARKRVPGASFLTSDMTSVDMPVASFDGITAFYSITHVPATEQGSLLRQIGTWLKPTGVFVGSFGTGGDLDGVSQWLGMDMFFSHNSDATTFDLLREAGLNVIRAEVVPQDNEDTRFLWVFARRAS